MLIYPSAKIIKCFNIIILMLGLMLCFIYFLSMFYLNIVTLIHFLSTMYYLGIDSICLLILSIPSVIILYIFVVTLIMITTLAAMCLGIVIAFIVIAALPTVSVHL